MATYAIVKSGVVVNIAEWDGKSKWSESGNAVLVTDSAGIGWAYDGKVFTAPPVPDDEQ